MNAQTEMKECPGCGMPHDPAECAGAMCDCCDAMRSEDA